MTDVRDPARDRAPQPTIDLTDPLQVDPTTLADTDDRLVAAAAQVCAARGYDGAGVQEIARRAGLTTGAIYSRYSGKAALLAEAIRRCTSDEFDQLFAEHAFEGRVTDVLATVGSHLVTRRPSPGQAILLEAFVAGRRDPEVAEVLREHLADRARRLGVMVDGSKATGLVDESLDTAALVHFAHAVGLGFLLFEAVGAANPEPDRWDAIIARVLSSIVPQPD
ncbi:MAG: TetR/AcrR family transcriptional regulator, partial [Acidimicrobiales bacterium]